MVSAFVLFSDDIRTEIKALKKEYHGGKKERQPKPETEPKKVDDAPADNELVQNFMSEQRKYRNLLKDVPKKGDERYAVLMTSALFLSCCEWIIIFSSLPNQRKAHTRAIETAQIETEPH